MLETDIQHLTQEIESERRSLNRLWVLDFSKQYDFDSFVSSMDENILKYTLHFHELHEKRDVKIKYYLRFKVGLRWTVHK